MGTQEFPDADGFDRHLSESNGMANAYTSHEETVYYFAVSPARLRPALDRWSRVRERAHTHTRSRPLARSRAARLSFSCIRC